jgi:hypothetical protein
MESQQINRLPLEREFELEQMRRYLEVNPEQAQSIALEYYEDYLCLLAENIQMKQQLQKPKKRLELYPIPVQQLLH